MFKPELYQTVTNTTKRDARRVLEDHGFKIKWGNNDSVIDLGCGDGGVTVDVLKRIMPSNFKKLIGCDIGEQMIKFANENRGDEKISFAVLDVAGEMPVEWKNAFDHAFSFYALHWIQQQEKAFQNIYNMLSKNGDCLLMFPSYTPLHDVYRLLSRQKKWSKWLHNVDEFVSPYQDVQEPEAEVHNIMAKAGFKNIDVICVEEVYKYTESEFKDTIESICPFRIPPNLMEEYITDYMREVRRMNMLHRIGDDSVVKMHYYLIIAYGSKQLHI